MSDQFETVYVWECLDQPGGYALCTNQNYLEFKADNWRYLGELPLVAELAGMPRDAIHAQTLSGWPMMVQTDHQGGYVF